MRLKRPKSQQPLPDNARKVFAGTLFDVYQWEQEMFDGSTDIFEKVKRPDTVIVFPVTDDGKIILTEQQQPGKEPFIGAAGGRVDTGEEILSAAKRELREETGYEAGEFVLWKSLQPISKIEWAVYVFVARHITKVSDVSLDAGEKITLMPVDFEEFLDIALQPHFAEVEIYRDIVDATLHPEKKDTLKKLFFGK